MRRAVAADPRIEEGAAMTEPHPPDRCEHGIRHPWQCDDCDAENPMPTKPQTPPDAESAGYEAYYEHATAVDAIEKVAAAFKGLTQ